MGGTVFVGPGVGVTRVVCDELRSFVLTHLGLNIKVQGQSWAVSEVSWLKTTETNASHLHQKRNILETSRLVCRSLESEALRIGVSRRVGVTLEEEGASYLDSRIQSVPRTLTGSLAVTLLCQGSTGMEVALSPPSTLKTLGRPCSGHVPP